MNVMKPSVPKGIEFVNRQAQMSRAMTAIWVLAFAASCLAAATIRRSADEGQSAKGTKYPVAAKIVRHDAAQECRVFEIAIIIDSGFAIYANPVEESDLKFAETTIRVVSKNHDVVAEIKYPTGERVKAGPIVFRVYKGEVRVFATVKDAALVEPVEIVVEVHPTDLKGLQFLQGKRIVLPFEKK